MVVYREVNSIWYWRLRISYRSQLWDSANTVAGRTAYGKRGKKDKSKGKQLGGDGAVWQSLFGSEETITPE